MAEPPAEMQGRFEELVAAFAGRPGVMAPGEPGRQGFGSGALKVSGSIFAMLTRGRLVVKLPRRRVSELIEAGKGAPYDAGTGTAMKEWLAVPAADDATWRALAEEAYAFVGGRTAG